MYQDFCIKCIEFLYKERFWLRRFYIITIVRIGMHLLATERKVKCCLCPVCSQLTFIHNEDLKGGTILSHVWLAPSTWWKFYKNHEMLFHISLMYCKSSVNNLGMRHFPFCPFKVQESTALEGGKNVKGRKNFSLHWNVDRQMFLLVRSTTRDT